MSFLKWVIPILLLGCMGCGSTSSGTSTIPPVVTPPVTGPAWAQVTLPAALGTNGVAIDALADGYLYAKSHETSPANVIFRALVSSPNAWTDITGTGLPTAAVTLGTMGITPNGTILVSSSSGVGNEDIFYWNGSTTSPVWTKVTGYNGSATNVIYQFSNDSAGYTYFSPAYSGAVWRNDAPNSTNFTRILLSLYAVTKGGTGTNVVPGDSGSIYPLAVWDLGDGKGDMLWAGGEGELDNIALNFSAASNTAYLTNAQGYVNNLTVIGKSPNVILALRASAFPKTLNSINIATRAVTVYPSPQPRTATSFPYYSNSTQTRLNWMYGNVWMFSGQDGNTASTRYILLSQDDGATWTDLTTLGSIPSGCAGTNLAVGATSSAHMIFVRGQDGKVVCSYGPV